MNRQTDGVSEELSRGLDELRDLGVSALSESRDVQTALQSLLQHEARRIERKLGRQHPRCQRLAVRLKANLELINGLEVERQVRQVKVPDVAGDAALVHGRVMDENGRGIAGLVVCLVDGRCTPIREAEGATTDATGYYAITLNRPVSASVSRQQAAGVFLGVFTARGRLVHRELKALPVVAGVRLVVNLRLKRAGLTKGVRPGRPPKPHRPDGQPKPATVAVPDLIGHFEEEALALLRESGLKVGKRQTQPVMNQVGLVLAQEPTAGTEVTVGTGVSLVIGVAEQVEVPEVKGLTAEEAGRKLQGSGLIVGQVSLRPDERVGIVLDQDPLAGEQVPPGAAVNLVVGRHLQGLADRIIARIARDPRFGQLGLPASELAERLEALGVETAKQAADLLDTSNPDLRDALGLTSIRRTETLKRILRQVMEELAG
jgi:hypothetical protein